LALSVALSTIEGRFYNERGTKIVEEAITLRARRITREELHQIVWQKPMTRLAEEFGISGNGLAKVCDRLNVPYPPRGYWAKKEAGKPVVAFKLPPRLNRAMAGWFEFARKTLDAAEANVTTFCDHASQLAQAESPVECIRLQTEFVKSSMASMQKQLMDMMRAGKEVAD
jgi:phasin protein